MLMNPSAIKEVVIDGHSLTIETFIAVARYGAKVILAPEALEAMKVSRALAEKIAAEAFSQISDINSTHTGMLLKKISPAAPDASPACKYR